MLRIKSAQVPDLTDVDARRVFGYAYDVLQTQQNQETIQKLVEAEQNLVRTNPHISFQELMASPLGGYLQDVLGPDHWTLNPDQGMI